MAFPKSHHCLPIVQSNYSLTLRKTDTFLVQSQFLLVYVLSMPFVYVSTWGWGVVPATGAIAFALLGIEGS